MKQKRHEGSDVRRVLAGMITDRAVCSRIASKWTQEGLFASPVENLIGGWCVRYFKKHNEPPKNNIQLVYEHWSGRDRQDEATVQSVGKLLSVISEEHGEGNYNSDFLLDVSEKLFRKVRMHQVVSEVETDLESNNVEEADRKLGEWKRFSFGSSEIIRPGSDLEFWRDVFDEDQLRPLFVYPGDLGKFVGNEFARECFVALEASSKRGKSWWLLDIAYRAVSKGRCRVAYFEAGDLSRRQIGRRLGQRALRRPKPGRGGVIKVPTDFPDRDEPPVFEERDLEEVTARECFEAWRKVQRDNDLFRMTCHSNRSLSVAMMDAMLREWADGGWVPDVIVLDYADILAPPQGVKETRDQINENWMYMRRMSQDYHCLLVTATQADAASYTSELLRRKNFSDDRRKHDHVTAMFGLNVTDKDKELGITRVNMLDRREDKYTESRQVWVAGCLEIGCPAICSVF